MKYCCFRFDADTHACVGKGMPRLLEVAASCGVPFTFFVNMGRAFDRPRSLAKNLRRLWSRAGAAPAAVPAIKKLGLADSLRAAVLNPRAGRSHPAVLRAAQAAGHELGLHGGRNHASWEHRSHRWSDEALGRELDLGCRWMAECGLARPTSFAPPAWKTSAALQRALLSRGFDVIADAYGSHLEAVSVVAGLLSIPTNITTPRGTAGYLEAAALRRWSTAELLADWKRQLAARHTLAVVYDHPFFAGIHAAGQLRDMIGVALDQGFSVCTMSEAAACLHAPAHPDPQPRQLTPFR